MEDVCHHGGAATSMEAFSKVAPAIREMQETVLAMIVGAVAPPNASALIAALPDMLPYTLRPRLTELKKMKLIEVIGRAPNPNGNNEYVYRATPAGVAAAHTKT